MGHYTRGDVVIAPVAFEERNGIKTRPAVVIATGRNNEVYVCPVSSKPSFDAPSVPITLDDFSEGGLDLFGESYVHDLTDPGNPEWGSHWKTGTTHRGIDLLHRDPGTTITDTKKMILETDQNIRNPKGMERKI